MEGPVPEEVPAADHKKKDSILPKRGARQTGFDDHAGQGQTDGNCKLGPQLHYGQQCGQP